MAIKSTDLLTVRQYENSAGIKVHVEIDRVKGTASLVEPDGDGGYQPKEWLFSGRQPGYLRTWIVIMQLMEHATKEAIAEIEAAQEQKAQAKSRQAIDMATATADDRDINRQIMLALQQGHRVYSMAVGRVGEVMSVGKGVAPVEICSKSRPRKETDKRHRHQHGATSFNTGDEVKLEKLKGYYMVVNTPWKG